MVDTRYAKGFDGLNCYLDGVSENTLRLWLERGMPCRKIGGVILFKLDEVDAWLEGFRVGGPPTYEQPGSERNLKSLIDSCLSEVSYE